MPDWRRAAQAALADTGEVRWDEPLARHTTFRIGGPADLFITVRNIEGLLRALQFSRDNGLDWYLLGRGSNVLISDQGLRGAVIRLGGELARVEIEGNRLMCGAGATMDLIADTAEKAGLCGAEFLAGIPGTIGGGLRTNAGAFGSSLVDIVAGITGVDPDGRRWQLERGEIHGGYRQPLIGELKVAVAVELELKPGRPEPASVIREKRWVKHPKEPSAGSFFRNPPNEPAGRLIERCGLKGRQVGGARVSEKHGNFIVNVGGARCADVLELAEIVKANVEEQTGVVLTEEVTLLPGFRR